jgi:ABC-type phosphate transport system substrate-binding protein
MRYWIPCVLALSMLAGGLAHAERGDFKVVANPSVAGDTVAKKDLTRIFLKQKTRWPDGQRSVPVDQRTDSKARAAFSEAVLGRSMADVESYWNGQVFAGKDNPPATMTSDEAVLDFVRKTPGAVGYVSANAGTAGVKVLDWID